MLDGQLLVAIGDVAGHSLHAATVMAEVRHAVRAYAVEGHPPGAVLSLAQPAACGLLLPASRPPSACSRSTRRTGRVRLANAGHLPPLLRTDGRASVPRARAARCSASTRPGPTISSSMLPPGGTLVLYTDGLVERRDARHRRRAWPRWPPAGWRSTTTWTTFCGRLLTELGGAGHSADDIAVVAIRRRR